MKNIDTKLWSFVGLCLMVASGCGRQAPLDDSEAESESSKNVVTITETNFKELLEGEQPLIVDFWAPWCGPCRAQAPIVAKLADELQGKLVFAKANVDDLPTLARAFEIKSIPTILVFHHGKLTQTLVGVQDRQTLLEVAWELIPKELDPVTP